MWGLTLIHQRLCGDCVSPLAVGPPSPQGGPQPQAVVDEGVFKKHKNNRAVVARPSPIKPQACRPYNSEFRINYALPITHYALNVTRGRFFCHVIVHCPIPSCACDKRTVPLSPNRPPVTSPYTPVRTFSFRRRRGRMRGVSLRAAHMTVRDGS